ncbi:hypothetical protein RHMOL_Rhmol11G0070000 [Rhododendron molle]|uniref:Uncharacterized protein n=1 Tax=Rhododendron molle TaxID=49168 RepID=A0ACC0LQK4_RHOML|nr:hypothetical protein RHMOL_Rhmol11G0070000 [Rhododendron molle]
MVIANYVLFHIRVHWVLCVVDLSSSTVYYMDSINKEVHSPLKLLIKTAFKIYDSSKGVRSSRIINWKPVECPKQPTNVECGFYVMKYMNDLIRDEKILSRGNVPVRVSPWAPIYMNIPKMVGAVEISIEACSENDEVLAIGFRE